MLVARPGKCLVLGFDAFFERDDSVGCVRVCAPVHACPPVFQFALFRFDASSHAISMNSYLREQRQEFYGSVSSHCVSLREEVT